MFPRLLKRSCDQRRTQFASRKRVRKRIRHGRTPADFRGRTTLITVWATWCGPCRDELPAVQKLYDLLKDRKDIQLITLNINEDPGLVEPFLPANAYRFPVLMSTQEFASAQNGGGVLGVPQNWVVDRDGILHEKSSGFNGKISDWPLQMIEKLERVSK